MTPLYHFSSGIHIPIHTTCHSGHRIQGPGGFECSGINFFCFGHIAIQQKDVHVDGPGAARPAACAPETGCPDLTCQTFQGIRKEMVSFLHQCDMGSGKGKK